MSLLYYPGDNGGMFGQATVGFAYRTVAVRLLTVIDGTPQFVNLEQSDNGLGFGVGAGYDVRLARNFYLTPVVEGVFQYLADHWATTVMVRLAATWH